MSIKKRLVIFLMCLTCIFSMDIKCSAESFENTIGQSSIDIVVPQDNLFTGLDTLIDTYIPQEIDTNTKTLLSKSLVSLVVSVVIGDSSYTLETFKNAFVQVCTQYGIEITEDFLDAIVKYATYYLDDEFEQNETDIMLSAIYSTLEFISIVLVLIWIGGARI